MAQVSFHRGFEEFEPTSQSDSEEDNGYDSDYQSGGVMFHRPGKLPDGEEATHLVHELVAGATPCDMQELPPQRLQDAIIAASNGSIEPLDHQWMKLLYWRRSAMMVASMCFPFYLGFHLCSNFLRGGLEAKTEAVFPQVILQYAGSFLISITVLDYGTIAIELIAWVLLLMATWNWANYKRSRRLIIASWVLCYASLYFVLLLLPFQYFYDFDGIKVWSCEQTLHETMKGKFSKMASPPMDMVLVGYIDQATSISGKLKNQGVDPVLLASLRLISTTNGISSFCAKHGVDGSWEVLFGTSVKELMESASHCLSLTNSTMAQLAPILSQFTSKWSLLNPFKAHSLMNEYKAKMDEMKKYIPVNKDKYHAEGIVQFAPCMFEAREADPVNAFGVWAGQIEATAQVLQKGMENFDSSQAQLLLGQLNCLLFSVTAVTWLGMEMMTDVALRVATKADVMVRATIGGWLGIVTLQMLLPLSYAIVNGMCVGVMRIKSLMPMEPILGLLILCMGVGSLPLMISAMAATSQSVGIVWISVALFFIVAIVACKAVSGWLTAATTDLHESHAVERQMHLIEATIAFAVIAAIIGALGADPFNEFTGTPSWFATLTACIIIFLAAGILYSSNFLAHLPHKRRKILEAAAVLFLAVLIAVYCCLPVNLIDPSAVQATKSLLEGPLSSFLSPLEIFGIIAKYVSITKVVMVACSDIILYMICEALHLEDGEPQEQKEIEAKIVNTLVLLTEEPGEDGHRKVRPRH